MAERFKSLFRTPSNLICDGTPIMIEEGALLLDNETGNVLAQLKLRNISEKSIKAVTVAINAFDTAKRPLEGIDSFSYLDLDEKQGSVFGSKVPVYLKDVSTREFAPEITEVIFTDGAIWESEKKEWYSAPKGKNLSDELGKDLAEEYRVQLVGDKNDSRIIAVPEEKNGLFFCVCGAVNCSEQCYACGIERKKIVSAFDRDSLSETLKTRLAKKEAERMEEERKAEERRQEEERKAEERRIAAEKVAKKLKKAFAIGTPIVAACIAFLIVLTTVIIPKQKLNKAMSMLDSGDYDSAYALLEEIGNSEAITSSKYDRAMALIDSGDYDSALLLLNGLSYKDSEAQIENCYIGKYGEEKWNKIKNIKVGDTYTFGAYEQDNNTSNGKEEIEWIVLDKDGMSLLLISKQALDCQPYNTKYEGVTWENCTLRKWMNGTFLNEAFSAEEQAQIISTNVSADKNPKYDINPGNATTDKVFLLSLNEAGKYFTNDEARKCAPTAYAEARGAWTNDNYKTSSGKAACWWWLRSPGDYQDYAALVNYDGSVGYFGYFVDHADGCVRPALWINLDS